MGHFAVIAIGADRPGIVAGLTGALYERGGNLEDVSSSILRGYFAIMLVVETPGTAGELQAGLAEAVQPLGVSVSVHEAEAGAPRRARATHSLVAYAADRPGIVAGLAGFLAERAANVTDLSCRLTGEDPQVYAMVAELALADGDDPDALRTAVEERGRELGVDVTFRPLEADTL